MTRKIDKNFLTQKQIRKMTELEILRDIANQIQKEYDTDISVLFFELKGEQAVCPDDYTIEIKSE